MQPREHRAKSLHGDLSLDRNIRLGWPLDDLRFAKHARPPCTVSTSSDVAAIQKSSLGKNAKHIEGKK
jgi:hypothetical protein